jgi:hypothetical protein
MSDAPTTIRQRARSFTSPLLFVAVSRGLLFAFAKAGPLFESRLGSDHLLSSSFRKSYPTLASLAHGEIANCARIARTGYTALADISIFPLLPWLGKGGGALLGSVELALLGSSLAFCVMGFVGVFRVFEVLRGPVAARWGVALLAAFPLSYHLSDGSAQACLLAFSSWGVLLALRGRALASGLLLSLGVLAHPVCVFAAVATAWPALAARGAASAARQRARLAALLPVVVLAGWLSSFGFRFHDISATVRILFLHPTARPLGADWIVLLFALGLLVGAGILLLARTPGLRALAVVGAAQLLCALDPRDPVSAHALAACWPAFLAGGDLLARREALRGPTVAVLAAHQGLLLFCFTHFVQVL